MSEPVAFGSIAWRAFLTQCHEANVADFGIAAQHVVTDPGLQHDLARELIAELERRRTILDLSGRRRR